MLKRGCFTKEWIEKIRIENPPADPTIIEKTIYAFELISQLVKHKLDFIFKGGTSLILIFDKPKRLSIDVDITTEAESSKIEKTLAEITKDSLYTGWVEDPRKISKIPKKHYKMNFNSIINPGHNSYILLDVLFQKNPYPSIISKNISNRFIEMEESLECNISSVNSLLGDKLTTFAPKTTGIPFGADKSMEINKQLFDIGELFDLADNIYEIEKSFNNFFEIESGYREKEISPNDVISDIIETSFLISQLRLKGCKENENTNEFISGMQKLRSHLIGSTYNLENAKLNSAKAAFIVSSFQGKENFNMDKAFDISRINNLKLPDNFIVLERLKNIQPDVYYLWQKITQ